MQRPGAKRLVGTFAIASALIASSWLLGGTKLEWLCIPLVLPGMLLAAVVFPQGAHSDHALIYLGLSEALNLIVIWMAAVAVLMLFEHLILRRREQ